MTTVRIRIADSAGNDVGSYDARIDGPWFWVDVPGARFLHDYPDIHRGALLSSDGDGPDARPRMVVGSNVTNGQLEILAPKAVRLVDPRAPYVEMPTHRGCGTYVQLRPGTTILGGRYTGFYDNFGVIIEAYHTGGERSAFEDWAYRVIAASALSDVPVASWITLDQVGLGVSGPGHVIHLDVPVNRAIDDLLATGGRELFEYLVNHPDEMAKLSPQQSEDLVDAVYRNLGFATQRLGAWNQADGGVDLVAISKSEAGKDVRLAIQVKTSAGRISARPLRELAGVLSRVDADSGVVATTSEFTGSAILEWEGHYWDIALQDRDALFRRMVGILLPDVFIDEDEPPTTHRRTTKADRIRLG